MAAALEVIPRKRLAQLLAPMLPPAWRIIAWQDSLSRDTLSTTVVMLKQRTIKRAPAAPAGAHIVEFVVTIATALSDPAKAEDDLDDSVNALIHALESSRIHWESATKVQAGSDTLAYDLTVQILSQTTIN